MILLSDTEIAAGLTAMGNQMDIWPKAWLDYDGTFRNATRETAYRRMIRVSETLFEDYEDVLKISDTTGIDDR